MLDGFETRPYTALGATRPVHWGGQGPGVLVMHEIPGITPEVAGFADRLVGAGYRVALPEMFGEKGKLLSAGYAAGQMARACVSREFHVLASHEASPITEWLRALGRELHAECGGPGIGALGMCLTGNFALALAMEPWMLAPVLSQPSLPFPVGRARRASLHVSPQQLAGCKRRVEEEGLQVLGLRFSHDPLCPPERFETLRRELGTGFEGVEIDSGPGNGQGLTRMSHSVVTTDLVDEEGHPTKAALDRVMALFAERLQAG